VAVAGLVGTVQLVTVIHDDFGWANPVTDWVSSIGMDQVGFIVVGLFALTWLVAAGVWRLGLAPSPQR
jgi:high-affinity nickel-transport protein